MKRMSQIVVWALAVCFATAGFAAYPTSGSIGLYSDVAGTGCCIAAAPGVPATIYIYANLAGPTAAGITGAEFRIELEDVTLANGGYIMNWTPAPASNLSIGNPIDDTPADDTDLKGVNVAFPECQTTSSAGAGRVLLGSILAINLGTGENTDLVVRRRTPPTSPAQDCPALVLCNAPIYTIECVTIQNNDPQLPTGQEAESFRAVLTNSATGCASNPPCGPVAVAPITWSTLKDLYR